MFRILNFFEEFSVFVCQESLTKIFFFYSAFEPLGTELCFKNQSALPCIITVCLRDPQLKTFIFEPTSLCVETNSEKTLKLFAMPDKKATFENQLLLSIQHNPKVEVINLSCTGCHVNFVIRPKLINFDHALINQTSKQEIVLENISDVSIFWKIIEPEKISKVFKFSCDNGNMAPSGKQKLFIEYTPFDSTGIPKLLIMIHVKKFKTILIHCLIFFVVTL